MFDYFDSNKSIKFKKLTRNHKLKIKKSCVKFCVPLLTVGFHLVSEFLYDDIAINDY